jgi:hypothetical protein
VTWWLVRKENMPYSKGVNVQIEIWTPLQLVESGVACGDIEVTDSFPTGSHLLGWIS